jgi:hypothetical protein
VATRLTYLELHRIIFEVSWILLIEGFQGLLNPLPTNCQVNLWKTILDSTFQTYMFFLKKCGMCKHHLVVVFHILLQNVYNLFKYCKTFFIYLCIPPSPSHPIHLFCQLFFSILFPMFWFPTNARRGVTECHFFNIPKVLLSSHIFFPVCSRLVYIQSLIPMCLV